MTDTNKITQSLLKEKIFPENSMESFQKQLDTWVKNQKILAFHIDDSGYNVKVITKSDKEVFNMFRFFPISNKWQVSIDVVDSGLPDLLEYMLEKQIS